MGSGADENGELEALRERDALRAKLLADLLEESRRRRDAEEELQIVNQRLGEAIRFKTDMLSVLAHELGNPISPILIQLHLLNMAGPDRLDESRQKDALAIVGRNVSRLKDLVADVLDVARMEAGRLNLDRSAIRLVAVVEENAKAFEESARRAGVSLRRQIEDDDVVMADPRRLGQVVSNLLSNAIKFSPGGGAVLVQQERHAGFLRVTVQDEGLGLSPEQIGRLFQPFTRVHVGEGAKIKGTGLGLYICRNLIVPQGGRLWAESDGPGKGSRFLFELPIHKGSDDGSPNGK